MDSFSEVNRFMSKQLQKAGAGIKTETQVLVATEEIFVNIVSYAYGKGRGDVEIKTRCFPGSPGEFRVRFEDEGIPFNPLENEAPDISLSAEDRQAGGLGIFMVRKSMDDVRYEYRKGKNCLTLVKKMG